MKKLTILFVLLATLTNYAQSDKANEVRLNALSMIASRTLDLSYEHYFSEESAVGASFAFDLTGGKKYNLFGINQSYAITPYYRYYFPKHISNGVFVEAFLSANGGFNKEKIADLSEDVVTTDDDDFEIDGDTDMEYVGLKYSDFAFGVGAGYKYASEGGFVAELFAGAGRNLSGDERAPIVLARMGVSFGFRF
jgi:hypothetical protein